MTAVGFDDVQRAFDLGSVALAADRRTQRHGFMYVETFLRHTGIVGRATASVLKHGYWVAVNGDRKASRVEPGDTVTVLIAAASLLELLDLPEAAAAATVGDVVQFRVAPPA